MKISFVSLGCFKNLVDTEVLAGMLTQKGVGIVSPYEEYDTLIINTCGFIREAKEESITEILAAIDKKDSGQIKHLIVFGCLTQRYTQELRNNFKNVDIIWGVNDLEKLADLIATKDFTQEYKDIQPFLYTDRHVRVTTTTPNVTFIKISEGCNMKCSFCAIPLIRGPYRSRPISSIIREAEKYKKRGVEEINIISQNSTYYGRDLDEKSLLPNLLKEISRLKFHWLRILYLMPEEFLIQQDELLAAFEFSGILPYFDLPFQHISPKILSHMNRGGGYQPYLKLIQKIRTYYKNAIIRATFMVGFPGESEKDFAQLVEFARESKIERIGVFVYSPEENTSAFRFRNTVANITAMKRKEKLMDISDQNLINYNHSILSSHQDFLPLGPWENQSTIGRISSQAPDVDGVTQIPESFNDDLRIIPIVIKDYKNEILYGEKKC